LYHSFPDSCSKEPSCVDYPDCDPCWDEDGDPQPTREYCVDGLWELETTIQSQIGFEQVGTEASTADCNTNVLGPCSNIFGNMQYIATIKYAYNFNPSDHSGTAAITVIGNAPDTDSLSACCTGDHGLRIYLVNAMDYVTLFNNIASYVGNPNQCGDGSQTFPYIVGI